MIPPSKLPTMRGRLACFLLVVSPLLALAAGCRGENDAQELKAGGKAYLAQCAVCHGPLGQGDGPLAATIRAEGKTPPAVLDAARVGSLGRNGVRKAIESGVHVSGGTAMPVWGPHLGREWTDRVTDYVVSMPDLGEAGRNLVASYLADPPNTPPSGRRAYVLYCSGCHGPQGGGDGFFSGSVASQLHPAPLRGASLSGRSDDELAEVVGMGGAHAPNATTMPGWLHTISPEDRQALVGYLRSLSGSVD